MGAGPARSLVLLRCSRTTPGRLSLDALYPVHGKSDRHIPLSFEAINMKMTNRWNRSIYKLWAPVYDWTVNHFFLCPGGRQPCACWT